MKLFESDSLTYEGDGKSHETKSWNGKSLKEYEPCSVCNNNKKKNLYSQQVEKQLRVALQNMVVLTD